MQRRQFSVILADTRVSYTFPRHSAKWVCSERSTPSLCDKNETFLQLSQFFSPSARSRALSSQPRLKNTVDYLVSKTNLKTKSNNIYVEVSFRHAIHSAEFVSGRLLLFHISKFYQIALTCWCVLPDDMVSTCFLATTSYTHRFINEKMLPVIVARDTIKQHITSQPWLWSDIIQVSKLQQTTFNEVIIREF